MHAAILKEGPWPLDGTHDEVWQAVDEVADVAVMSLTAKTVSVSYIIVDGISFKSIFSKIDLFVMLSTLIRTIFMNLQKHEGLFYGSSLLENKALILICAIFKTYSFHNYSTL